MVDNVTRQLRRLPLFVHAAHLRAAHIYFFVCIALDFLSTLRAGHRQIDEVLDRRAPGGCVQGRPASSRRALARMPPSIRVEVILSLVSKLHVALRHIFLRLKRLGGLCTNLATSPPVFGRARTPGGPTHGTRWLGMIHAYPACLLALHAQVHRVGAAARARTGRRVEKCVRRVASRRMRAGNIGLG
jgi:hypothetical protein